MHQPGCPKPSDGPAAVAQFAKFERLAASPGAIKQFVLLNALIDVSSLLASVRTPTLVLHRRGDMQVPIEQGRELAAESPARDSSNMPATNTPPGSA